jgi:hypothetical protein
MAIYAAFTIDQGASFQSTITIVGSDGLPMILTGKFIYAQIRKSFSATTYRPFLCNIVSATVGQVSISLTAQQTSGVAFSGDTSRLLLKPGRYMYDVIVSDSATLNITAAATNVSRVLEGQIEVTPSVTR